MVEIVGEKTAKTLREKSLQTYQLGAEYAKAKGIIIADTKFEWGWYDDELTLIDEVLTPDSSRFWPEDQYQPGGEQFSYDKQFVRNYLDSTDWDKNCEPPQLPPEIVRKTREKYIEAFELLTETDFPWK
jgi:phosphoribosylaminoimidazole-succinocarboxamide synthase